MYTVETNDHYHFHKQPAVIFFHLCWFIGLILFCISFIFICATCYNTFWILNSLGWFFILFGCIGLCIFRRRYYHYHCHAPSPQVVVVPAGYQTVGGAPGGYYAPAPAGYAPAPAGYAPQPAAFAEAPAGYTAYQVPPAVNPAYAANPGVKLDP
jgi:hypothetical protein